MGRKEVSVREGREGERHTHTHTPLVLPVVRC